MVNPNPIPSKETMNPEKLATIDAIRFLRGLFSTFFSVAIIVITFSSRIEAYEQKNKPLVFVLEDLLGSAIENIDMDPALLARKTSFKSESKSTKRLIAEILRKERLQIRRQSNGRWLIEPNPFAIKTSVKANYKYDRAPVEKVLASLFHTMGADYVLHQNLQGIEITLQLKQVQPMDVLQMISRLYNLQVVEFNGIYSVRRKKL